MKWEISECVWHRCLAARCSLEKCYHQNVLKTLCLWGNKYFVRKWRKFICRSAGSLAAAQLSAPWQNLLQKWNYIYVEGTGPVRVNFVVHLVGFISGVSLRTLQIYVPMSGWWKHLRGNRLQHAPPVDARTNFGTLNRIFSRHKLFHKSGSVVRNAARWDVLPSFFVDFCQSQRWFYVSRRMMWVAPFWVYTVFSVSAPTTGISYGFWGWLMLTWLDPTLATTWLSSTFPSVCDKLVVPKTTRPIVVPTGTAINVSLQNGNSNKNVEFNPQCEFNSTTSIRNCARGTVSNQQFSIGLSTLKTRQQCKATKIMVSTAPEVDKTLHQWRWNLWFLACGSLILWESDCVDVSSGFSAFHLYLKPSDALSLGSCPLSCINFLIACLKADTGGAYGFFYVHLKNLRTKAKQRTWQEQFARHAPGTSTFWN